MEKHFDYQGQGPFSFVRYLCSLGRWFYLLHALVLMLFFYPYFEVDAQSQYPWILACVNSAVVIAIIYAVSTNFHQLIAGCSLGLPALLSYWLPANPGVEMMSVFSTILLYGYATLILISHLLKAKKVTSEDVFGAASLYLLLGIGWAFCYQLVELISPGAFYINQVNNVDGILNWSDFLYYSFVTITTLGYGEMTPITSPARSLAMMEAVTGVMFVAVMIARIVSLSLTNNSESEPTVSEPSTPLPENPSYRDVESEMETHPAATLPAEEGIKIDDPKSAIRS